MLSRHFLYSRLCCGACFCFFHPCCCRRHHRSPFWDHRSYSVVSLLRCCWCWGRRLWTRCPALCFLYPLSPFWRTGGGGGRCRRRRPNTEVRTEFPTLHYVQSSETERQIKLGTMNYAMTLIKLLSIAKWAQGCKKTDPPYVFGGTLLRDYSTAKRKIRN